MSSEVFVENYVRSWIFHLKRYPIVVLYLGIVLLHVEVTEKFFALGQSF